METFSALLTLCVGNSPVTDEFHAQSQWRGALIFFFNLRLNKRLNKPSWGWLFETPSRLLWRHRNAPHPEHPMLIGCCLWQWCVSNTDTVGLSFLIKFSSLAALKVVILTTFSAASDGNFVKITTFLFQWITSGERKNMFHVLLWPLLRHWYSWICFYMRGIYRWFCARLQCLLYPGVRDECQVSEIHWSQPWREAALGDVTRDRWRHN